MFCCVLALVTVAESAEDTDYIRQYQFEPASSGHPLVLKEVPRPVAGASDVVVRVKAVSLNRRDINMLNRNYDPDDSAAARIPLSDGAGEVIAVGEDVTRFSVGDRVAGIFFESWIDGAPSAEGWRAAATREVCCPKSS
jgi:NADPH:quinone reductase-like Zn-dependent oxidoreductase